MKKLLLLASLFCLSVNTASALPVTFSVGGSVSTVDRNATFDSLTSNGINLSSYSEDSLNITTNGTSFQGFNPFKTPTGGDNRSTGFHYENRGNNEYVTISNSNPIDTTIFSAIDFLLGDGFAKSSSITNIQWETYLDGTLTDSGFQENVGIGQVIGWSDFANGFDELRVAAYPNSASPGFGSSQNIAIDDLRVQVAAVPVPAAIWLFGSGLIGLFSFRRKNN